MKAERKNPPPPSFIPVTLTLETQGEVDAVFSFLNHCTLCKAVGLPSEDSCWKALAPFRNDANCDKIHDAISKTIKRGVL